MLLAPREHIEPTEGITGEVFGVFVMSRLVESKKAFIAELKRRGHEAGKQAAENMDYEKLWKLRKEADSGAEIETLNHLMKVVEADAEELFGDEFKDESDESEFIVAWVESALAVLDAIP